MQIAGCRGKVGYGAKRKMRPGSKNKPASFPCSRKRFRAPESHLVTRRHRSSPPVGAKCRREESYSTWTAGAQKELMDVLL